MEAARFLKKSQLSDVILSKIWDMADPQSRGTLDKSGMFVALKLCAFAQAGRELKIDNLNQDVGPPKMVISLSLIFFFFLSQIILLIYEFFYNNYTCQSINCRDFSTRYFLLNSTAFESF